MTTKQATAITIYSKDYCPYCKMAKAILKKLGLSFDEFDITNNVQYEQEMRERSKRQTVPQIFINNIHLGGYDDLQTALRKGELKQIIQASSEAA